MALRVQAANRPILDAEGFFHGAIAAIKPVPSTDKYKAPRFRWTIEGPGSVRVMGFHFTTTAELGDVLEEEEFGVLEESSDEHPESDELTPPTLSTLAQVCLKLELVTSEDLEQPHLAKTINELDLEAALGVAVKCRLAKKTMKLVEHGIERKTPYISPVIETLTLDK